MEDELTLQKGDVSEMISGMDKVKAEITAILNEKVKSAMFRCKMAWHTFGECPSKYYFNLEKRN